MKGRFFIDPGAVKAGAVYLSQKESHHAVSVLRIKTGDAVELLDGAGNAFRGIVSGVKDKRLLVSVQNTGGDLAGSEAAAPVQITLGASVIKPDAMDVLIQKACELGVSAILPIIAERCVVKLSQERWQSKLERWRKIALESCKQCGRPAPPNILPLQSVPELLKSSRSYDTILIPTLAVSGEGLVGSLKKLKSGRLLAMIGPEGDFTPNEVQSAVGVGARPVSLGPWVLRSETAAMYVISAMNFYYRECVKELP